MVENRALHKNGIIENRPQRKNFLGFSEAPAEQTDKPYKSKVCKAQPLMVYKKPKAGRRKAASRCNTIKNEK